MSQEIGEAIKR